ncbi:MAG TPA: VOC family protein [Rhizomicrobium sp.]|jgi:catechol 2,3-dioxygenase-like lactoylglutathione lyase family enzyme
MSVELNHTIVHAKDHQESAAFLAEILGLPDPEPFGHFLVVRTPNGVSLDFMNDSGAFGMQHYAFLVSEAEFESAFGRIKERGLDYWADPAKKRIGEINRNDGGRGVYFHDPSGHFLEILTVPYGGGRR